jgi:hypothetical protein
MPIVNVGIREGIGCALLTVEELWSDQNTHPCFSVSLESYCQRVRNKDKCGAFRDSEKTGFARVKEPY